MHTFQGGLQISNPRSVKKNKKKQRMENTFYAGLKSTYGLEGIQFTRDTVCLGRYHCINVKYHWGQIREKEQKVRGEE